MESRINRSSIQCWFETQPTGCRKPHCVFMHQRPRHPLAAHEEQNTSEGLILPVITNAITCDQNDDNNCINNNNNNNNNGLNNSNVRPLHECSKIKLFDDSDYLNQSLSQFNETTTHNIEPISISINDCDEESDNENELTFNNSSNESETNLNYYNNSKNYGIKTLEQIRMEKVFNNETDDCLNDSNNSSDNFPKTDSIKKTQKSKNTNKDLRVKIKRRPTSDNESKPSVSNLYNDKIVDSFQQNESLPDFGIKTLDQIRREREEAMNKKQSSNSDCKQSLSKENQEPRGEKRSSTDPLSTVVKIRRTGPTITSSLKSQQTISEREKSNEKISSSCEEKVTSTNLELNESSAVSSSDSVSKQRLTSIDTDLDEFDFLDGDSSNNIDTNIDDDEDDELMREINQVINS
jgi:hypothetical protein